MANPTTDRMMDYDGTFVKGMVSSMDVSTIPMGAYEWSMNMVHRGGVLMVRPGYRCLVTLPTGKLQGAALFRPKFGIEQILIVIDGRVWIDDWPFTGDYRELPNIRFSEEAPQIYFQLVEQSVQRIDDSVFESEIEFLDSPKNVIVMQDGGYTAPAWYDGSAAAHSRDTVWGIPIGGPMAWVGDRLWVANGSYVYASDIANPLSFREQIYLGGVGAFVMPGSVTALAVTPSLDLQQLLVFTEQSATLLQANVRSRDSWLTIDGFQTEVYKIGCVSQRSVVPHYGQLWWFSPQGVVNLDMATQSKISSRVTVKDIEMTVSGIGLGSDLSLVAGAAFGNYVMQSVPFEDLYNTHTWVLDNAAAESLQAEIGPTWCGYWTGTRPVQWIYGVIAGQERILYVSKDYDGNNRLWEAFTPDREDNNCPITWAFGTRGYFGNSSGIAYPPGRDKTFCYADLALCEIIGNLDIGAFWAGGTRGKWKKCLEKRILSEKCSLSATEILTSSTILYGFKPQSRLIRTQDVRQMNETSLTSCPVERDILEASDDCFQLLVVGQGHGGVRWIRSFAQSGSESLSGVCEQDEDAINAVRFDGASVKGSDFSEVAEDLTAGIDTFESVQIVQLEKSGYTATGTGSAESVISQGAADRVASVIATEFAEKDLREAQPPLLSDGSDVA
jgi:hypothetical protein